MEITQVKIRQLMNSGRLRALVSIVIDNTLALHDIKIISGKNRFFVAMPSKKETDGSFRDVVHPLGNELREKFEQVILAAYREAVQNLDIGIDEPAPV